MKTFFKAQLSSLLASSVDFLVMVLFVEIIHLHYTLAVLAGAIAGALANFLVNRYWSFQVSEEPAGKQSIKYALVWTGSVLLNVSGIYLLTHFLNIKYILSKIIVSVSVGISFNYFLQKNYVFTTK